MKRLSSAIIVGIITSFYLFPFKLTFFSVVNTKVMVAILGIVFFVFDMLRDRDRQVDKNIFVLFSLAMVFSLICLVATIVNNTTDYEYVTYVASMTIWLLGAYGACSIIRFFYGHVSLRLVCNCLVGACIFQCLIAIAIDNNNTVRNLVDLFAIQGSAYMRSIKRLYGVGAALDVAGTRFASCLVIILYFLSTKTKELKKWEIWFYIFAFFIVFVFGNMIARTTTIGMVIGLVWALLVYLYRKIWVGGKMEPGKVFSRLLLTAVIAIPFFVNLYNTDSKMHDMFRFAFEGFFSIVEQGRWQVDSNDKLSTMVVLPDNTKTWIIGDGYMTNPLFTDNHYVGITTVGNYYMATDIGYLRLIYYCGLVGLFAFILYFLYAGKTCCMKDASHKWLYIMLVALNFAIWLKVLTDIFVIIALMVCAVYLQKESSAESDVNEVLEASLN